MLSHFNRQRLDAEAYHDTLLAVGGNLNETMGGPSGDIDTSNFDRRAVYATISRQAPSQFLQVYDFPDPTIHSERRAETTTALQQLFVMNSPFAQKQAIRLANRATGETVEEKIRSVYHLLYGREPNSREIELGQAYLQPSKLAEAKPIEPPHFVGDRLSAKVPQLGDKYSVELWLRNELPHDERPVTGYFLSRGPDASKPTGGDHLGILGTYRGGKAGRLIYFNGDRLKTAIIGRTTLETDRWVHLVFVRDGLEVRVYLNGNPEPEVIGSAAIDYDLAASELFIGGRNDRFANFQGQMGGVAVFDRPLTPQEISQHYQRSSHVDNQVDFGQHFAAMMQAEPAAAWPLFEHAQLPLEVADATGHEVAAEFEGDPYSSQDSSPWVLYCHALLCSNELMFVD